VPKKTVPKKSKKPATTDAAGQTASAPEVHLYVLLDRSGSMASMADDVIGGFNQLLADQQADGADARMTLVQFDTEDAQHVVADAVPVAEMLPLDATTFVPRGGTPLLDATGILLARVAGRVAQRAKAGLPAEQIVIVSITDGHENASREFTLSTIKQLIGAHRAAGWTFVFLGAALDVYGEAADLGYDPASVQSFVADGQGSQMAFASLSRSVSHRRAKIRDGIEEFNDDFYVDKAAEADRQRRQGS
jgi:Mg-chelatase subunit ChlD